MRSYRYIAIALATIGIVLTTLFNDIFPNGMFLMGICIGVLFAVLASTLTKAWLNRNIQLKDKGKNETILREEGSTYFQNFQGKSGKLFLTNKRLCFVGKGLRGNSQVTIRHSDIKDLTYYDRAMLPTGFQIRTKDGTIHAFAVDDRAAWIQAIQENGKK